MNAVFTVPCLARVVKLVVPGLRSNSSEFKPILGQIRIDKLLLTSCTVFKLSELVESMAKVVTGCLRTADLKYETKRLFLVNFEYYWALSYISDS